MRGKHILAAAALATLSLGGPAFAAQVDIKAQATGTGVTTVDGTSSGASIASGTVLGNFTLNTASGVATSSPAQTDKIDLATLSVSSASCSTSQTLTIWLTETGLTGFGTGLQTFASDFTAALGGSSTVSYTSFVDSTDTAFGTTTQVGTTSPVISSANPGNQTPSGSAVTGSLFSETIELVITVAAHTGTISNSTDGSLYTTTTTGTKVPEPSSLLTIAMGLATLGYFVQRKRTGQI